MTTNKLTRTGGTWTNPNNPALLPAIMGTYAGFVLLYVAWITWTSVVLIRSKA